MISVCNKIEMLFPIPSDCMDTQTSDIWLVLLVESMLANFVALLVSFGLWILSVLLFVDFSSFTAAVLAVCLLMPLRLIFALLFVIMSSLLCVRRTAILISQTTTLSVFVLVGFVFLLSALFFWNFKSSIRTPGWSAAHQLPTILCVLKGLCLTPRIPYSTVKTLDFTSSIPAVGCASFLRFRALVRCPPGAAVSTVALDLPTKSTSICFPSVTVSASWRKVIMMFVCVLCVLTKSGVPPPATVTVCKSAVYIYPLRFAGRFLRQGRPVRPFFSLWIPMFERLSCLLNKIEMLLNYCPLHQHNNRQPTNNEYYWLFICCVKAHSRLQTYRQRTRGKMRETQIRSLL